jgi:hypothetical protein
MSMLTPCLLWTTLHVYVVPLPILDHPTCLCCPLAYCGQPYMSMLSPAYFGPSYMSMLNPCLLLTILRVYVVPLPIVDNPTCPC